MAIVKTIYERAADFAFSAIYQGSALLLTIVPAADRFAVLSNGTLLGHIKIGYDRHTWFAANSQFVESALVNEIGRRIISEFY